MPDAYDPYPHKLSTYLPVTNAAFRKCEGCFGGIDKGAPVCAVPMSNSRGDRWYVFLHDEYHCVSRMKTRLLATR